MTNDPEQEPVCVRCGKPVVVNRQLYAEVFEKMHWLCFHLEYEHPGDPDAPCGDPSCYLKAAQKKGSL